MRRYALFSLAMLGTLPSGQGAHAQAPAATPPITGGQVGTLLACRSIADQAGRLACFDRESAAVASAISSKELTVVSRDEVRKGRRSLFGLSLPNLGIFGDNGDERDTVRQVEGVVASATERGDGNWLFRLQDGATWSQIDNRPLARGPRPGSKVVIKRGGLGGYMMNVDGQIAIKVRRVS